MLVLEFLTQIRTYEKYLNEIDQDHKKLALVLRRMGSAAIDLAYVASGKLDAFWERNLNLWDIVFRSAAYKRSLGEKVTEINGNNWNISSRDILASNS